MHVTNTAATNSGDGILIGKDSGNNNSKVEIRGSSAGIQTPYVDFSNDDSSDFDMRLRLADNDTLNVEGGNLQVNGLVKSTNDAPVRLQFVHRRVLFGYAGDTGFTAGNTWTQLRYVYGPFSYAVPSVQSGAVRRYRLYAIYSDNQTTEGENLVLFDLDCGTDVTFSLPRTWGGVGSENRDAYSDWYIGQPCSDHGYLSFRTTQSGRTLKLHYLELQAYDYFQ